MDQLADHGLHGKVAVVTGALGSLGVEICDALRDVGATVVRVDMKPPASFSEPIDDYYEMSITDPEDVQRTFREIAQRYRSLDILINCAGITHNAWLLKTTPEDFEHVMLINVIGTFNCLREAAGIMKERNIAGHIVNFSSIAAEGNPGQVAYSASKAAVESMTAVAGKELGKFGIRVNALAPGLVAETGMAATVPDANRDIMVAMTPVGHLANKRDIANVVWFLVSGMADHITGATIPVTGGLHLP